MSEPNIDTQIDNFADRCPVAQVANATIDFVGDQANITNTKLDNNVIEDWSPAFSGAGLFFVPR